MLCQAEVRGSGRVHPRAWTEVGVWPFRYWTARNKQTSCSRPWPPPCRIQDVCVSSSLCLNTVCGMTCEGGQLWQQELGNLGPVPCLLSPFSLSGSSSSSLLLQALGLTHPHLPLCPQEGLMQAVYRCSIQLTLQALVPQPRAHSPFLRSSVSWCPTQTVREPFWVSFNHSILLDI